MLKKMFTDWKLKKTYRTKLLKVAAHGGGVADRQSKIPGFSQEKLSSLTVLCAGAGGLATAIGESLVRKGVGRLVLCDEDTVEPSNLNRQKFYKRDIWKNKALRLARNLAQEGFLGTEVIGIAFNFMDAIQSGLVPEFDSIMSAIDDDLAREQIAEYALAHDIPLTTVAVSRDGDGGYVHKQRPGESCWGCVFPRERRLRDDLENYRAPCPGTPAIKDILMVVSGAAVYALDTLFMDRPISWNYREFHLAGYMPDTVTYIERRPDCQLCGSRSDNSKTDEVQTQDVQPRSS